MKSSLPTRRTIFSTVNLLLSLQFCVCESDCPADFDGWVSLPGCKQYYLCEAGARTSTDYSCSEGYLFDSVASKCMPSSSVSCETDEVVSSASEVVTEEVASEGVSSTTSEPNAETTAVPKKGGEDPIFYFIDTPSSSCVSVLEATKPDWVKEIFPTKEECCKFNFSWKPLEDCMSTGASVANVNTMSSTTPSSISISTKPTLQATPSATLAPVSKDDPEYFFFCGVDWMDASTRCYRRCSTGNDDECMDGEICFSEADCPNGVKKETLSPTVPPTIETSEPTKSPTAEPVPTSHPTLRTDPPTERPESPTVSPAEVTSEPTKVPTAVPIRTSHPTLRSRPPTSLSSMKSEIADVSIESLSELPTLTNQSPLEIPNKRSSQPTTSPTTVPIKSFSPNTISISPAVTLTSPLQATFSPIQYSNPRTRRPTKNPQKASSDSSNHNVLSISPSMSIDESTETSSPSFRHRPTQAPLPAPSRRTRHPIDQDTVHSSISSISDPPVIAESTYTSTINSTYTPFIEPSITPSNQPSTSPTKFTYVVKMIADSSVLNVSVSSYNQVYGYGQIRPQMGAPLEQDGSEQQIISQQSSLYDQIYGSDQLLQSDFIFQGTTISPEVMSYSSTSPSASELIIPVSSDASVSSQRSGINFGTNSLLALDSGLDFIESEKFDILLTFDLSLVDSSSTIKKATIQMFSMENCESGGKFYATNGFSSNLDSSEMTWSTAPDSGEFLGALENVSPFEWNEVDVTSAFDRLSETSITFRVESNEVGRCFYASKEHLEGKPPTLVLNIEDASHQILGMSDSLNEIPPVQIESAQRMTIATGEIILIRASADASIDAIRSDKNLGDLSSLHVSLNTETREIFDSLILFNLKELQQLAPSSAMLTLFPEVECPSAGIMAVTGESEIWLENNVTWATAPTSEFVIGTFGPVEAGHWYGFNVVKALEWAVQSGRDHLTIRISIPAETTPCQYSSVQSGRAPKLMVSF